MADALRKGIIHPKDLRYEHVKNLLGSGTISGHATEKTDGAAFEVGHDENGPYTRSARSPKIYAGQSYEAAARARFGDDLDPTMSRHYDNIHNTMMNNKNLQAYLKQKRDETGSPTSMSGEIFYKPFGQPAEDGGIRFVGTSYDRNKMGKLGSFIMHSQADGNGAHDPEQVKALGDQHLNFDHDVVENGQFNIDARDLKKKFDEINPEMLTSRKREHATAKAMEQQKLIDLNDMIDKRIRTHTDNLEPKWGKETEGYVVKPKAPNTTKMKLTSATFKAFKAAQKARG
jgi:hypothetical protein